MRYSLFLLLSFIVTFSFAQEKVKTTAEKQLKFQTIIQGGLLAVIIFRINANRFLFTEM